MTAFSSVTEEDLHGREANWRVHFNAVGAAAVARRVLSTQKEWRRMQDRMKANGQAGHAGFVTRLLTSRTGQKQSALILRPSGFL